MSSLPAYRLPFTLAVLCLLSACSASQDRSAKVSRTRAFICYNGSSNGSGKLRLAVKDLIDVRGLTTTAGCEYVAKTGKPARRDARCLELARQKNVEIVGKTNLTELAATVSGDNAYFGTPRNLAHGKRFIPGGSSSGSAVAVKSGMADVAFGTDTAGSIRVPAACCGIYGLKTTFGLVSLKGVFPLSPKNLDTVGPMAKDIPRLVEGMALLQDGFTARYKRCVSTAPSGRNIRIGRLYLNGTDPKIDKALDASLAATGFKVIQLDQRFLAKWSQAQSDGKAVAFSDLWLSDHQFASKAGVSNTTKAIITHGELDYTLNYRGALKRKAAWQKALRRIFRKVDFIALPTLQELTPRTALFGSSIAFEMHVFDLQNTVGVNFAGNPALAMPIAMPEKRKTFPFTSLQLIAPPFGEAGLLNAARLVDASQGAQNIRSVR